jgi:hypothetical protein
MISTLYKRLSIIIVASIIILSFGALFTRVSPGCCMLSGTTSHIGFPFPYRTIYNPAGGETYRSDRFTDENLAFDIISWLVAIIGISIVVFTVSKEKE